VIGGSIWSHECAGEGEERSVCEREREKGDGKEPGFACENLQFSPCLQLPILAKKSHTFWDFAAGGHSTWFLFAEKTDEMG